MKKSFILMLQVLILCNIHYACGNTWFTVSNGNWNDSTVWFNGVVPSYSIFDTIYIRDTVFFNDNIIVNTGAFVQIDSMGGAMCGHHNITTLAGTTFNKYGALDVDTFYVKGGAVNCIIGGQFLIALVEITGGFFDIQTNVDACLCPWEYCFIPVNPVPPADTSTIDSFVVFPNPNNGNFSLRYTQNADNAFYLFNALGQLILIAPVTGSSGEIKFSEEILSNGIYFWKITNSDNVNARGEVIIAK